MDISIVVPVYNEEESLRELTASIAKVMNENRFLYEIIMVDDGSTDSSWDVINNISQKNANVKGISFRRNYGKSAALQTGFEAALGEVVITMDADLQDDPEEIPELYKMIRCEGYDMVSGWKKKRHDPIHKRWPSKFYNRTVRAVSGIKLHDFNCGLKAYRKDVVKSIEVYGEMHRYIPVIAKWAGFRKIGEKVVNHHPRKFGESKFGMERYAKGYLDLLTITFTSRYGRRPMHIFGLMGTLLFVAGLVIAIYLTYQKVVNQVYMMTSRPLFYLGLLAMVLGTILFVGGFLGELIVRNNPDRNKYLFKNNTSHASNRGGHSNASGNRPKNRQDNKRDDRNTKPAEEKREELKPAVEAQDRRQENRKNERKAKPVENKKEEPKAVAEPKTSPSQKKTKDVAAPENQEQQKKPVNRRRNNNNKKEKPVVKTDE